MLKSNLPTVKTFRHFFQTIKIIQKACSGIILAALIKCYSQKTNHETHRGNCVPKSSEVSEYCKALHWCLAQRDWKTGKDWQCWHIHSLMAGPDDVAYHWLELAKIWLYFFNVSVTFWALYNTTSQAKNSDDQFLCSNRKTTIFSILSHYSAQTSYNTTKKKMHHLHSQYRQPPFMNWLYSWKNYPH